VLNFCVYFVLNVSERINLLRNLYSFEIFSHFDPDFYISGTALNEPLNPILNEEHEF